MGGMAWFAYTQVSDLLLNMSYQRLKQESKSFGMSLVEELTWSANALVRIAGEGDPGGDTRDYSLARFAQIRTGTVAGLDSQQLQNLDQGHAVLKLTGGRPQMIAALDAPGLALVGQIDPATMWRNDSSPEHYCVLNTQFVPLYCTTGFIPPGQSAMPVIQTSQTGGVFPWRIGQEDFLVGYWQLRFLPTFASPGFVIMVAEPKSHAMKSLDRFRQVFPAIFLLSLALAAFLAFGQILRQTKPLGELTEGTRRLTAGDFDTRVRPVGNDEFADLGRDFNTMASALEYKFNMLRMLADLDRDILGAIRMDTVIRDVLSHIRQAVPCDGAGLLSLDRHGGGTLSVCQISDGETVCNRYPVDQPNLPAGYERERWLRIDLAGLELEYCRHMSSQLLSTMLAFPIAVGGQIESLLILVYALPPSNEDDICLAGRSLADRLAIAHSSFAWAEKLYHQANYDFLTDLPNRVLLRDRAEQAISHASRDGTSVGLMLIDLDNFKQINDSLGHSAGDTLLIEYAHRLKQHTRESDTVARLGGDEFIILISGLPRGNEYDTLDHMARSLNKLLARPVMLDDQQVISPASIGIALYPENAAGFEELWKMADAAMYESKQLQPGGFQFYSNNINVQTRARFELTQELREAVAKQELVLFYQPKVRASDGQIVGAEALVRWNSPNRGLVPPSMFVRLLDEIGLGTWLGEWVLDTVCRQLKAWEQAECQAISVSINLSPHQFERTPIVQRVRDALSTYQLAPDRLELEILEATVVSDREEVRESLVRLRDLGVSIALDDFGTGYSSLVYLAQVPANVLKLDRAFIRSLATDVRQQGIVKLIISLAKVMDFTVVAEGVEETSQLDLLAEMGCDLIQGYLISRPVPADEFAQRWLV